MKWNPTSDAGFYASNASGIVASGGRHYIYVMGSYFDIPASTFPFMPNYDEGNAYHYILNAIPPVSPSFSALKDRTEVNKVMFQCIWAIPAFLSAGHVIKEQEGMPVPESEVRFKIRVEKIL